MRGGVVLRGAAIVGAATAFALAYTQHPLYDGNYNTYLLHALAAGGLGWLRGDWLAGTTDPFPLVSAIARVALVFGPRVLHVLHAALLGVYLLALVDVAGAVHGFAPRGPRGVAFAILAIVVHSAMFRALVKAVAGGDWGYYLQAGVAGQYLLGYVLQPSLFGVLVIASLAAFLRGRDLAAVALAAAAVAAHASYGLPVASLVCGYGVVRGLDARDAGRRAALRAALRPMALGAALLVPVALHVLLRFAPTDRATLASAEAILADVRIPHHALPRRWVHASLWIQLPLVAAGVYAARRSRLSILMLMLAAVAALLTAVQLVTGDRSLALAFPWRASVFLVPLSTALLLGKVASLVPERGRSLAPLAAAGAVAAVAAAVFGVTATRRAWRRYGEDPALAMMAEVRARSAADEVYVVPTDMQRFRLETGARTFVDWKSHPYADREVVAWQERIVAARAFERAQGEDLCRAALSLVERHGVTHFVIPTSAKVACASLVPRYRDRHFSVYAHAPGPPP